MDFSITGQSVGLGLLALILVTVGVIFLVRSMMGSKSGSLSEKYKGTASASMKKYPEANVFNLSSVFWRLGLVSAVGLAILAFSWTTYEEKVDLTGYSLELPDDIEIEPPRTAEPPPPPPPPPPPVIEEVPDDEPLEDPPKFKDQTVTKEMTNKPAPKPKKPKPKPKPKPEPKPKKEKVDKIFQVVEQMPRFPGCDDAGTDAEKDACAGKKLLEYIYKNIKYPTAIELDYAMQDGVLKLEVRAAMAGYLLRRWNVDCTKHASLRTGEYQLWLRNHHLLVDAGNPAIAPGYIAPETQYA